MATTQLISIGEYLGSVYRPDVDYVDGRVEERHMGETDHSKLQTRISFLLYSKQEDWRVLVLSEVRVQVAPTRFRIPDVCVVREDGADEPIVKLPPLLCLEVLSPRDSIAAVHRRAQDFLDMGVPEVWVFALQTRSAYVRLPDSMSEHKNGVLRLQGTEIELSLAEAFRPLQRQRAAG